MNKSSGDPEIARGTGLSKQTISDVMRELERDGWVRLAVVEQIGRLADTLIERAGIATKAGCTASG